MTDAISRWFLRSVEAGFRPWEVISEFMERDRTMQGMHDWVANRRTQRLLEDDDVTIMRILLTPVKEQSGT